MGKTDAVRHRSPNKGSTKVGGGWFDESQKSGVRGAKTSGPRERPNRDMPESQARHIATSAVVSCNHEFTHPRITHHPISLFHTCQKSPIFPLSADFKQSYAQTLSLCTKICLHHRSHCCAEAIISATPLPRHQPIHLQPSPLLSQTTIADTDSTMADASCSGATPFKRLVDHQSRDVSHHQDRLVDRAGVNGHGVSCAASSLWKSS